MEPEQNDSRHAELYEVIIEAVHDATSKELTSLRSMIRLIVEQEIAARRQDIARDVAKELGAQIKQRIGTHRP